MNLTKKGYAAFIPISTLFDTTPMNLQKDIHEDIQKTIKYIWGTWLPKSGYEYTGTPDFELYDDRFNPLEMKGEIDIYIPIRGSEK